ncbi:interferon regulatory factor 10 isoform X2 [Etheostoma cragini]|uniref:interferon regulatory factor 10 isoform X2 n=1 Tax=Etheostoma cragini TaxID=417921 RepID=UPI00155DEAAA|nr:interferon regulatory factor 10 isoform X2 [Etheostoma cragini]
MEAKMHMKEWLIAQIDSGEYEGLLWEDDNKTMFRIPWKHAAKKDYKQTEDAALFKAWAVYKGKYREGRDKADPTMWKTRLRCALNKSTDFQEVPCRNQLDISEPYKVYLIHRDNGPTRPADSFQTKDEGIVQPERSPRSPSFLGKKLHCQKESFDESKEAKPVIDFRMQVVLLYQGQRVTKVATSSPDGCFILQGRVPLGNERIYGPCTAQQLSFPSPSSVSLPSCLAEAMNRLLCHLERGVLLWVAPDGVFIKRFCQGRVYWSGPMAQHTDRPNKLEREKTFKLLDIATFLNELQSCLQGKGHTPSYEIELCFGEEYPDPNVPKTRKLIMAQVVPLFAVELMQRFNLEEIREKRPILTSNTEEEKM